MQPQTESNDIEVQDWVVKKLELSDSRLTDKDMDRISTLVAVYLRTDVDIKKVVTKYKKEDIFKSK